MTLHTNSLAASSYSKNSLGSQHQSQFHCWTSTSLRPVDKINFWKQTKINATSMPKNCTRFCQNPGNKTIFQINIKPPSKSILKYFYWPSKITTFQSHNLTKKRESSPLEVSFFQDDSLFLLDKAPRMIRERESTGVLKSTASLTQSAGPRPGCGFAPSGHGPKTRRGQSWARPRTSGARSGSAHEPKQVSRTKP